MGSEKYILLDFPKYLSFSEVQKNSKVVNVWITFQEEGSFFQKNSIRTNFWYVNAFSNCEICRLSEICCA